MNLVSITPISDLGFGDYSEWFIGHAGSTYYRKSEKEKAQLFAKIEPYLTFLDYSGLEARGAYVVTKLQEKDKQIEALTKKQEQFEQLIQSLIESGQLKPLKHEIIYKAHKLSSVYANRCPPILTS